jgi:hypothetical protein
MKKLSLLLIVVWLAAAFSGRAAEKASLNAHLEPLRPLLEKTWKGTFNDSKPEKPTVDTQRWERALNGQAVRLLHSINDGVYGGETLFVWDEKKQTIAYYYFTTVGYMTTGSMEVKEGKFISREEVKGDADGVTEVRATSLIQPDGKFHVKAEYLKNGAWTLGHEVTYEESPGSKVTFK